METFYVYAIVGSKSFAEVRMLKHSPKHCRKVANVAFNDLPSSRSGGGRYSCDVCTKNGVFLQVATVYCTVCSLMYCAEHEKVGVLFVWRHLLT